jgi:hypothetical protein
MTDPQRRRLAELLAIFAGREALADIGQLSAADARRLAWAVTRGLVERVRRPWPGPVVGTCIKTWYLKTWCPLCRAMQPPSSPPARRPDHSADDSMTVDNHCSECGEYESECVCEEARE